jgi:hypothetical protein
MPALADLPGTCGAPARSLLHTTKALAAPLSDTAQTSSYPHPHLPLLRLPRGPFKPHTEYTRVPIRVLPYGAPLIF